MHRTPEASAEARAWLALLVACGIVWYAVLGVRPLFNPDEGRYAAIPAEMLATGDFTVPHLDGVVYLEKPPLQYWATALALAAFGHHEWAARVFTATAAVVALLFVYLLGRRAYDRERALTAAAMAGSMLLYVFMGQLITLDMALGCFLTIAIVAFARAQLDRDADPLACRRWMLGCWAAMAAATLTKGLVGIVIPGAVLVLYTLWQRDVRAWRHLHLGKGAALLAALTLPWFGLVERAQPGALDFLIVREHFQRYLTRMHDRYQPWWYFLMILALGALPWLPQIARALATGWRARAPRGEFDTGRLLWTSVVFTVAFFSLSDSKLAPYIVPVLPSLALLAAARDPAATRDLGRAAALQLLLAVALVAAVVVQGRRPLTGDPAATYAALRPWALGVAATLGVSGIGALALHRRHFGRGMRLVAAGGFAVALLLIVGGGQAVAFRYSGRPMLAAVGPLEPTAALYAVDTFDWTMPFYTGRAVTPVMWRGELDYGLTLAPDHGIAELGPFEARWRASPAAYALVSRSAYARLAADGLEMRVLGQDFDNFFVSRR